MKAAREGEYTCHCCGGIFSLLSGGKFTKGQNGSEQNQCQILFPQT